MPTTKLQNSKVNFAIIEKNDKEYLVCTSTIAGLRIRYVENLETGKRIFPTEEHYKLVIDNNLPFPTPNLDKLVDILINDLD